MKPDKRLYQVVISLLKKAYDKPMHSVDSTQWSVYKTYYKHEIIYVLAVLGTNGPVDWLWNLLLLQKDGVKYGSYISAQRIINKFIRSPDMKLVIVGHSKSGPTCIYLQELLNADYCIVFEPARGFIDCKVNSKTIMFIDKDDIVPKLGWSRFCHREADVVYLPKDKKWFNIYGRVKDHLLNNIEKFINNMKE